MTSIGQTDARSFNLSPGNRILRKELHERWGGRIQGGISPTKRIPAIFIFWSPAIGEKHGYYDEFRSDGCFYYTGAGQLGDQQMRDANLALLRHTEEGRSVYLFAGAGGEVEFVDELVLDQENPFAVVDAPETGDGPLRKVFEFKFHPQHGHAIGPASRLEHALDQAVEEVPIERAMTERFFVNPNREEYEAERREQALVKLFESHLRSKSHDVFRLKIVPTGERRPIFCDLLDRTTNALIEAKGTVARDAIRHAIGQLMDYRRFAPSDATLAVLVPERPRADLLELLGSVGIEAIWPDGDDFEDTADRRLIGSR
jgi:hypothetical protein